MPSKYFFDDYHFIYCFNEVSFVVVDLNYIYLCVCSHVPCTVYLYKRTDFWSPFPPSIVWAWVLNSGD